MGGSSTRETFFHNLEESLGTFLLSWSQMHQTPAEQSAELTK